MKCQNVLRGCTRTKNPPLDKFMMMHIHSWNVRGLEMPNRKYVVRKWCSSIKEKDIIYLQEIKKVGFHAYTMLKFLWGQAIGFHSNHDRGKGGTAILVGPKWADKIIANVVSPCQRALWITFKDKDCVFGICNIYATNDYRDRASFWDWLTTCLPNAHWSFVGDFNMIKHGEDKCGGNKHCWKGNEHFFWVKLKRRFNLADPLERKKGSFSGIWFT